MDSVVIVVQKTGPSVGRFLNCNVFGLVMILQLKRLVLCAIVPIYILRLKLLTRLAKSIDEYVSIAFESGIRSLNIKPVQVRAEITKFLELLRAAEPECILEIGTGRGGTLYLLSRVSAPNARLVSVDLPGGLFGVSYPVWKLPLYRSFADKKQTIRLFRSDSHSARTEEQIKAALGQSKLDLLFIDGDHTYQGVLKDFEMYSPLVKPGGLIAFHDIVLGPSHRVGEVPRFWEEAKANYRHIEIVDNWLQEGLGIGVLWLPDDRSTKMSAYGMH